MVLNFFTTVKHLARCPVAVAQRLREWLREWLRDEL